MKDYTDITVVLDRSGSMSSVKQATIDGFDEFVNGQKVEGDNASITLVQFDDEYEPLFTAKPITDVVSIADTYQPRGATALLDAIGKTIVSTGDRLARIPESERPDKVIFVIITDGYENASREYNRSKIFEMIRHQESKYSWEFVFIGANQDAIAEAAVLGIKAGSAVDYDYKNMDVVWSKTSEKMSRYRAMSSDEREELASGSVSMFDQEDRDELVE